MSITENLMTLEKLLVNQDNPPQGSLVDWGISYKQVELSAMGKIDIEKVLNILDSSKI